ncbi:MAG: DsrE family protein [Sulfuriferula sp.]
MNQRIVKFLAASMAVFSLMFAPLLHAASSSAQDTDPIKVVYHITDNTRASSLLKNVQNHLEAAPGTKIAVVAHGKGIDFMLNNAQDANGNPYNVMMETLAQQGVQFKICNNTLKSRNLTAADVAYPVTIVPAGIAEIARLQAKEGYVYVKP